MADYKGKDRALYLPCVLSVSLTSRGMVLRVFWKLERERSSMVPKLRQHENFSASDFCIPGLVRIPNRTVMKASTPRCVFILTLARLERAAISGAQRKHTVPPLPPPALTSRGPPCLHQYACTQCARTGLLAAWRLQLYLHHKLTLKKYVTCQHDSGLHFYTAHAHFDILAREWDSKFREAKGKGKGGGGTNYKRSYIFGYTLYNNKHLLFLVSTVQVFK